MKIRPSMPELVLTRTRLVLLTGIFVVLTGNASFFSHLTGVYAWGSGNAGFLVSMALLLTAVVVLMSSLASVILPARVVCSVIFLTAAVSAYFTDQFGVVIDSVVIRNIAQTNVGEASDLMGIGFAVRILLFGILPIAVIWRLPVVSAGRWRELRYSAQTAFCALVVVVGCVLAFSGHYASFFREHKSLRLYSNPTYPYYSLGKYVSGLMRAGRDDHFIQSVSFANGPVARAHSKLVIMVVGETARASEFSLNGYARDTNPYLAREAQIVSYSNITACGTSTAVAVPCMFAFDGRKHFDVDLAQRTENVLDVLAKAGVNVLWRDNNSDSKGVATRVDFQDFRSPDVNPDCDSECRDTGLLGGLQEYIDSHDGDIFVVLHQMGSHGPAYYKRYPPEFERYTPACQSIEFSECSNQEIINAYDNSILYTDFFLSEVIGFLKANTPNYQTTMLYVSDHGESLGEKGLYLHGLPFMLAPDEQTMVPLIAWIGESSIVDFGETMTLKDSPNSHDAIVPTLLALFQINSDANLEGIPPLLSVRQDNTDE